MSTPSRRVLTYLDAEVWVMAVLANADLTLGAKVSAVALRGHLNFDTAQLNPSAKTIAKKTLQTERAVLRHFSALKSVGFVDWTGSKGRTSNRYQLLLPTMIAQTGFTSANHEPADIVEPEPTQNDET